MLTVPEDLVRSAAHLNVILPQVSITQYHARQQLISERVFVTRPTLVLVVSGIKQLASIDTESVHTAAAGSLIAFRSGVHLMSEFRAESDLYRSLVFSFDKGFLRQAIGVPKDRAD